MNKDRRKRLQEAIDLIESARTIVEECRDEEEEYRDNMPENLQDSDKYYMADEAVDNLTSALESLEDVTSPIEEAIG